MEVVTHPTDGDYSEFILALPCRIHQSYSLARTNRNPKPEDNVPDYKGPATMRGSRVEALLFWPRNSNNASARATLGLPTYVSLGPISALKTMHALPWRWLFPGHLFTVNLARHQLADGASRAKDDRGWHPPYSSLASPLKSKYHLQNHPSKSPKLVCILTGIWCPSGASLRQEYGSMRICFDVWCHLCTAPAVVHRSMPRISEGRRFPSVPSNKSASTKMRHC